MLWKNGVVTNLSNNDNNTYATSVFVTDNDVFVSGNEGNGSNKVSKIWKNGIGTNLTEGIESVALSVFVK